jgi:hypothetical protein
MAQPGDDWPPLAVDIPDDASELDREVVAYRRELRAGRRRAAFERVFFVRRLRRYGLAGPIGVGVLVLVAAVGSLLALLVPSTGSTPPPLPLAAPAAAVGTTGGLLPDIDLQTPGRDEAFSARSVRPAIVALVPRGCDCPEVIRNLAGQATEYRLRLLVVTAEAAEGAAVAEISAGHGMGLAVPAYDVEGALAEAYDLGTTPTAVLVHADGVVKRVVHGVDAATRLEIYLPDLLRAGNAASA